jgi:hypothetical protein
MVVDPARACIDHFKRFKIFAGYPRHDPRSCWRNVAMHHRMLEVHDELELNGLRAGLTYLNGRVPHRFTGVYQAVGDVIQLVELVDNCA